MKDTIIISGMPCIGKTELAKKHSNVLDLESSKYRWIIDKRNINPEQFKGLKDRIRNEEFPYDYLNAIKENMGKYDFILISQHNEILDLLEKENIDFLICYATKECKNEYIKRCIKRNNNETFIKQISENFEMFVDNSIRRKQKKIVLHEGEYLEDKLKELKYI